MTSPAIREAILKVKQVGNRPVGYIESADPLDLSRTIYLVAVSLRRMTLGECADWGHASSEEQTMWIDRAVAAIGPLHNRAMAITENFRNVIEQRWNEERKILTLKAEAKKLKNSIVQLRRLEREQLTKVRKTPKKTKRRGR